MDEFYTVKEVAKYLRVNVNRIYDLIKAGLLPATKIGCLKISKTNLEKFLDDYTGMDLTDLNNIKKIFE